MVDATHSRLHADASFTIHAQDTVYVLILNCDRVYANAGKQLINNNSGPASAKGNLRF